MLSNILDWIANSGVGQFMTDYDAAFPWVESIHVLAISSVLGMIVIVDLRLIGWATTGYKVSRLTHSLLPVTWAGFALAACTGYMMFASKPHAYVENTAFKMKMVLLVLAGLNMAVFHVLTWRSVDVWDHKPIGPIAVRAAGVISLLLWAGVVICGRWIGFTMDPF